MDKMNVEQYFKWRYKDVNWDKYGPDDGLTIIEKDMYDAIEGFLDEYVSYLNFSGTDEQWADNFDLKSFH